MPAILSLLKLISLKDWLYFAAFTALAWAGLHYYHKYTAAVSYAQQLKTESDATKAKAAADLAAANKDYEEKLFEIQGTANAAIQDAEDNAAAIASRLRAYAATHNCPDTVLQGTASSAPDGTGSAGSVEQAVEGLINAAAHDYAVLQNERAERDALTGK